MQAADAAAGATTYVAAMNVKSLLLISVLLGALALGAVPALAALGDEVTQGRAVAGQLQAGTTSCSKLSDSDFEHLGEYAMDRMVGSRSAHEAMNARMDAMMGSANTDRMHQALGRRFAGCGGNTGGMMGGGGMMMGGGYGDGDWGAMMGSGNWSWMRDGSWQHMTSAQWRQVGNSVMGPGMMRVGHSGWSSGAVIAVVLGALLVGGLVVLVAIRRPWRRHREGPATI